MISAPCCIIHALQTPEKYKYKFEQQLGTICINYLTVQVLKVLNQGEINKMNKIQFKKKENS